MKKMSIAGSALFAVVLVGCTDTVAPEPAVVQEYKQDTAVVDYKTANNVVYFDFSTGKKTVVKHDLWDIAFGSDMALISNSGRFGFGVNVALASDTVFAKDYSAETVAGITDTSATGNVMGTSWYEPTTHGYSNKIYLIKDEAKAVYKVQVTSADMKGSSITMKIGLANAASAETKVFTVDPLVGKVFIDCGTVSSVEAAPKLADWDVKFVRNQEIISPTYTAGRSSIELNKGVSAGMSAVKADAVLDAKAVTLSDHFLAIGHSWYDFDQATMVFSVPTKTYVVKDAEGSYYKMQISSFYGPAKEQFWSQFVYLAGNKNGVFAK